MRKSQKPWASVDVNVHQPRSQGIFHEAEFARDIFQLISILRFLVVTTVLLHGKERQGKLADLSSLPLKTDWKYRESIASILWRRPGQKVFPFQ